MYIYRYEPYIEIVLSKITDRYTHPIMNINIQREKMVIFSFVNSITIQTEERLKIEVGGGGGGGVLSGFFL